MENPRHKTLRDTAVQRMEKDVSYWIHRRTSNSSSAAKSWRSYPFTLELPPPTAESSGEVKKPPPWPSSPQEIERVLRIKPIIPKIGGCRSGLHCQTSIAGS
ncbi:hypothetical protein NL676_030360 [Syzygium grande]|nr:hypothetical protein NL676_030360 [Syzygium grande]